MTTPTSQRLYDAVKLISPTVVTEHLCASVADQLDEIEILIRDTDTHPGWGAVMDAEVTPPEFIDWLGQFGGVDPLFGLDEAGRRLRLQETAGFKRGSLGAIRGAARQYLTGTKTVGIEERYGGSAYVLRVQTYTAETPDPAATEAAIRAQKPAGIVLIYVVQEGLTVDDLTGTIDAQTVTVDDYANQIP